MIQLSRLSTAAAVALLIVASSHLGAQPTLEGVVLNGGPGDQDGRGVAVASGEAYAVGWDYVTTAGQFVACGMPLVAPDWTQSIGLWLGPNSVTMDGSMAYLGGWALPPYCGASDGVGGTEVKPALYRYDASGTFLGCGSTNFFPYRGGEGYLSVLVTPDSSFYLAGAGEEMGWGGSRTILARYALDGTLLWKRRYATDLSGNHLGGTYVRIGSAARDQVWMDGYLYVSGHDRDAIQVGGPEKQGMLLKVDAAAEPTDPSPGVYATNLYPVWARLSGIGSDLPGVAALDGFVYVAGSTFVPGDCDAEDLLVQKYDPDGTLIWSSNPAEAGAARFSDIVAVGNRLYAVGQLDAACDGNLDLLVAEVDPTDGTISNQTLWGGALLDQASGATSDGDQLLVVGTTRSFGEAGNALGQSDMVLLQFSVEPPDSDGDGVIDDEDACPETAPGAVVTADGCSIAQLCPCGGPVGAAPWKNHGAYVRCVAHASELFVELGLLTEEEKDATVSAAARSSCPP